KHILLPFSYKNTYGISSLVKQILTLEGTSKINDRVFDYRSTYPKHLALEAVEDKAPAQTSEALLFIFRELKSMNEKPDRQLRASTFQSLVSELRGLEHEVLKQTITQMVEEDKFMTWQALIQCGTPECGSAMFSILKTFETDAIERKWYLVVTTGILLGNYSTIVEWNPIICGICIAFALSKRFKIYKKYTYQYEAEIQNRVTGTSPLTNGPKISCKVEIDVPVACSFELRTSECSLTEVVGTDANGAPIYAPAAEAQAFQAAIEKNVLKFVIEGETGVTLYPEGDETNILNFKRGIISALIVPVMEKEESKDMQYPLSKLIGSTQTCNYKFDNQKKHMTSATCTEKHIFLPFSYQ
ncbi:apolipoprotein B-100-like, partial [Sinocyclocheilus rhinocerous]|uniref:apolipoprotein B-100-like n=1 Tax=Sinocyclocheilus rhinocerous TaxID=307959 RepID=UPI0007BA221E